MMYSTPEMGSSLLGGNSTDGSSQKSAGRSLLERIQLQRQREQEETAARPQQVVQIPNHHLPPYPPVHNHNHETNYNESTTSVAVSTQQPFSASPFPNTPWTNPFASPSGGATTSASRMMMPLFGGGSRTTNSTNQMMMMMPEENGGGMGDSLLLHQEGHNPEQYSMGQYFMTFVGDIYGLFLRLHVVVRVVVVLGLLYVAYWLL